MTALTWSERVAEALQMSGGSDLVGALGVDTSDPEEIVLILHDEDGGWFGLRLSSSMILDSDSYVVEENARLSAHPASLIAYNVTELLLAEPSSFINAGPPDPSGIRWLKPNIIEC